MWHKNYKVIRKYIGRFIGMKLAISHRSTTEIYLSLSSKTKIAHQKMIGKPCHWRSIFVWFLWLAVGWFPHHKIGEGSIDWRQINARIFTPFQSHLQLFMCIFSYVSPFLAYSIFPKSPLLCTFSYLQQLIVTFSHSIILVEIS